LHDFAGIRTELGPRVRCKMLIANGSWLGAVSWHGLSDVAGMIPLLVSFFALGALMCAMIMFDPPGEIEPEPRRRPRRRNFFSRRADSNLELLCDQEVETSHTAMGSAHRQ
jgi:hypothetical protein